MYPLILRLSTASPMIFSRGLNCIPSAMSFFDAASALTSPGWVSFGNLYIITNSQARRNCNSRRYKEIAVSISHSDLISLYFSL